MATIGEHLAIGSLTSGADLSARQFCAVTLGSGGLTLPSAGGSVLGILQNVPAAATGSACHVAVGFVKGIAAGSITKGDFLKVDTSGHWLTATAAEKAAGAAAGQALASASDNDKFELFVFPNMTALAAAETVTSGALNVGIATSYVSVTGTQAFTLADGQYVGQRKRIECSVAATTPAGTLTINDAATGEPTTWLFNAVGQMIEVEWTAAGWKLLAIRAAGTDAPSAASTLNLLVLNHRITLSGTQDWVLPDGEVPGQIQVIHAISGAGATGTISGLFYDEDGSADGIDANYTDAGDLGTFMWDGARWLGVSLTSVTITT